MGSKRRYLGSIVADLLGDIQAGSLVELTALARTYDTELRKLLAAPMASSGRPLGLLNRITVRSSAFELGLVGPKGSEEHEANATSPIGSSASMCLSPRRKLYLN